MISSPGSICAKECMQGYKAEEILVVVKSDALVDPDAVMVKFFDTGATHIAVF